MEVLLDDHVLYRVHGCLEQIGVGSIGVVNINLTFWNPVDAAEAVCEVFCGSIKVSIRAGVIGEVFGYGRKGNLRLEEIDLV